MSNDLAAVKPSVLGDIRANSGVAIWSGLFLIVLGVLALAAPAIAGMSITLLVGLSLLGGGLGQCFIAYRAGLFGRGLFAFLLGALTTLLGGYMVLQPAAGLEALTLLLAAFFIASGVLEFIAALSLRPAHGWGWMLFSALLSFVLGAIIWRQFPVSGTWAIGVLFGIRLLMSGWMLLFLGLAGKKLAKA
jgi:uncharacterized membrane protein HdeD (DUF308 family)